MENYNLEKNRILKVTLVIAMVISAVAVYLDFFVLHNSIMLSLADSLLFLSLVHIYFGYETIITNKNFRLIFFCFLPLMYFPLSWLGSNGGHEIGILYFFLFSSVLIYVNPNPFGLIAVIGLLIEVIGFIIIGSAGRSVSFFHDPSSTLVYATHFGIAGLGNIMVLYNVVARNNRLSERLYHNSTKDFLTNTYNRRYIDSYFEKIDHHGKHNRYSYLLFFDVDRFKDINDLYGHERGDQVLRLFADVVSHEIRSDDLFGRYGGDEFILVVNDFKYDDVISLQNRIQTSFESKCQEAFDFIVTISTGVERFDNKKFKDIIHDADRNMYQDKKRSKVPN